MTLLGCFCSMFWILPFALGSAVRSTLVRLTAMGELLLIPVVEVLSGLSLFWGWAVVYTFSWSFCICSWEVFFFHGWLRFWYFLSSVLPLGGCWEGFFHHHENILWPSTTVVFCAVQAVFSSKDPQCTIFFPSELPKYSKKVPTLIYRIHQNVLSTPYISVIYIDIFLLFSLQLQVDLGWAGFDPRA